MHSRTAHPARSRLTCFFAALATIGLGLASRRFPDLLPSALGKYPGDVLWAMFIFTGCALLAPGASRHAIALCALLICYADEFSQLYQAPWLVAFRHTSMGKLIFGSTFSWADMSAYSIGILLCVLCEMLAALLFPPSRSTS